MYVKRKQKLIIAVSLLVVACLLAASAYVYIEYFSTKKEIPKVTPTTTVVDNRISPDVTQGLFLKVNRIRNRGSVDALMSKGSSWKSTPQFYFISNMDGLEYISKDVAATAGASNEQLFTTWDSWFMENKVQRTAEQEQERSDVTLTIMERMPLGIFGFRYQDEEQESIQLTYDYKTGRWTGDDSFNDSDGYGHYLGDNYEVWFYLYQTDYDADFIPYWTEVNILHTNPVVSDLTLDPDGDGCPTTWEWQWGYDPLVWNNHTSLDPDNDGITNIQEYQMQNYYSNPFIQNVYLEVDNMQRNGLLDVNHNLFPETAQFMMEQYAQHNIILLIDNGWPDTPANGGGQFVPYYDVISQDSGMMLQFYKHYFPDDRKGIFRYAIIANSAGFCHPSEFNRYDSMAISTHYNFQYSLLRKAFTQRTKILAQASELMHELGHSMGIKHETIGGCDNFTYTEGKPQKQTFLDTWGNYRSCMNYYYFWDYSVVDYSDGSNGPEDNDDWAMIKHNMSYFKQESIEIEQTPPPEESTVRAFIPRVMTTADIPPLR
jgi:hypothetical protein